jgi:hypothetical protein
MVGPHLLGHGDDTLGAEQRSRLAQSTMHAFGTEGHKRRQEHGQAGDGVQSAVGSGSGGGGIGTDHIEARGAGQSAV